MGHESPLLLACALALLAGCSDDTKASPLPASTPDAAVLDPDRDAGVEDASTTLACTGGEPLAVTGTWVAADGTEHWLRRTASATTYTRIPSPHANATPPVLLRITRVCSDARFFIAQSSTSTFARVDWSTDGGGLSLCIVGDGAPTDTSLLAMPLSTPGATGCNGGAWLALARKDGGA